jgi:hypothetical protein
MCGVRTVVYPLFLARPLQSPMYGHLPKRERLLVMTGDARIEGDARVGGSFRPLAKTLSISGGSVAKFRWSRENGLNASGAVHVRVQVATF